MNAKEHVNLPTLTMYDPCVRCRKPVRGIEAVPQYILSNRDSVIDGIINPFPNPIFNERVYTGVTYITFLPCGHTTTNYELEQEGWTVTQWI